MEPIEVVWGDGYVSVTPPVPALEAELKYYHRTMESDNYGRPVSRGEYRSAYETNVTTHPTTGAPCKQLICLPGLLGRIINTLKKSGVPYNLKETRKKPPAIDPTRGLHILHDFQMEGAWTLAKYQGGCLACPTGWGKGAIIAALLMSVDRDSMVDRETPLSVVTTPDLDICKNLYKELQKFIPDRKVGIFTSDKSDDSDDILVVSTGSLHNIPADEVGVCIFDEVHGLGSDTRSDAVAKLRYAIKWGVSATPTGRFDGGDLVTESVVGPVIYRKGYVDGVHVGALVPIQVVWCEVDEPPNMQTYLNLANKKLSRYNRGVKKNPSQCKWIQDILNALPEDMQALCIMEHLQQMNELKKHIPDIDIVHAQTSSDKLLKDKLMNIHAVSRKERADIYRRFSSGELKKLLSTHVYKQGVNFPSLNVLIQAGGGGGAIASEQIPGRASRKIDGKDVAYLVDFWHPWDQAEDSNTGRRRPGPVFRDDQSRRRIYKKLGFNQVWVSDLSQVPFLSEAPN